MSKKDTYCGIPTNTRQAGKTNGLWMHIDDTYTLTDAERKKVMRWFKRVKDKPSVLILPARALKALDGKPRERKGRET